MNNNSEIRRALLFEGWTSMYDLVTSKPTSAPRGQLPDKTGSAGFQQDGSTTAFGLSVAGKTLGYDIVTYLDSQFSERQHRLNLSARQMENAKTELFSQKLIKEIWLGKSLFLVPTPALYTVMGFESPYEKRNISDIHSFLVLLAEKLIEPNPLVKYTRREVPLDNSNSISMVDLIVYLKSGERLAYEIVHRSITNVAALAARLEGKGFAQVIFLATDFNVKERVWASIRSAGFDPDFLSTIRCTIFSAIIRQKKELMLKGRV
jgi:hypothetical protein